MSVEGQDEAAMYRVLGPLMLGCDRESVVSVRQFGEAMWRAALVGSEARERELEAERDKALDEIVRTVNAYEAHKWREREAVLVEALKEKQAVIDFAAQALRASEQVGGPTVREAWHLAMVALTDAETEKTGHNPSAEVVEAEPDGRTDDAD